MICSRINCTADVINTGRLPIWIPFVWKERIGRRNNIKTSKETFLKRVQLCQHKDQRIFVSFDLESWANHYNCHFCAGKHAYCLSLPLAFSPSFCKLKGHISFGRNGLGVLGFLKLVCWLDTVAVHLRAAFN